MSTRSGACVWWSNARDRADRGGLPRRGVTSRNYTGFCCCHRAVGRLAALLSTTRPPWRPPRPESRVGRLREAQDGETGAAGASLWRASLGLPPPPRKWQKPWKFPGLLPCSEIRGLGSGGQPQTGSINAVNTLHASRCGGHLGVVSAAATHLHNLWGRRVHVR